MSVQLIFDIPKAGFTTTEAMAVYTGFKGLFTATSDAVITKILAGES
jgi:hypothetical protein